MPLHQLAMLSRGPAMKSRAIFIGSSMALTCFAVAARDWDRMALCFSARAGVARSDGRA